MTVNKDKHTAFGGLLRFWRDAHALSQQELAAMVDSSTRHINRLENGHVHPSESMVMLLVDALKLKHRDSDHLFIAAGYKPRPHHVNFNSPELKCLRTATTRSLKALEPYPSVLVDSYNTILMVNRAWLGLIERFFGAEKLDQIDNYLDFLFFLAGPKKETESWRDVRSLLLMWLQQEMVLHTNMVNNQRLQKLLASPLTPKDWKQRAAQYDPMTSYRVPLVTGNTTQSFYNVGLSVAPTATASYLSEPRLTINTLYPENEDDDMNVFAENSLTHALLY